MRQYKVEKIGLQTTAGKHSVGLARLGRLIGSNCCTLHAFVLQILSGKFFVAAILRVLLSLGLILLAHEKKHEEP